MNGAGTKARFWKCALQVNPSEYIRLRGAEHGFSEAEYNAALVQAAITNDIKVIGVADHDNVDAMDSLRNAMRQSGILVFPGFEVTSSEKVHFVCLYSEETTTKRLNQFLGDLQISDPKDERRPSRLSAEQLIHKVVNEHHGLIYAAHCTEDSGLLNKRLNHIWKNPNLQVVQIPGNIDDLKSVEDDFYRKVILNKVPEYCRDRPIVVINAKDVAKPEDLSDHRASCLIKMTHPGFEAFKLAFQDGESRVRLNSESTEEFFSRLERLKIIGGYLDGLEIDFSEHLNSIIGGRGTGKSTLLECIRYALGHTPLGKNARKQHDDIIRENLGKSKARVELTIRSSKMNGQRFRIARRYGESISVEDDQGDPSAFTPKDLLPEIEIFGQNEIYEIAQDKQNQMMLLRRFLQSGNHRSESILDESLRKLKENREKVSQAKKTISVIEDEVERLPKLKERLNLFKSLGIEGKLKKIPLLERSKRLLERAVNQEGPNLREALATVSDSLPDTEFLSEHALRDLPHAVHFQGIKKELDQVRLDTERMLSEWQNQYKEYETRISALAIQIEKGIAEEEQALEKVFRDLPACEGKSGQEIGVEYQQLLKTIERIRPQEAKKESQQKLLDELLKQRISFHNELSAERASRSARFDHSLKRLNKRLSGWLRLSVKTEGDRRPIIDFLLKNRLEGVGEARLAWIEQADDFSPFKLADLIRQGPGKLKGSNWGLTPTVAEALCRLDFEQLLLLEEIELPDVVQLELNVSHEGKEEYRPLERLSTGQQCTAILLLLLLDNRDPLIMDQPEDNLDNAFIAERIVSELRRAKIRRQFLFATHNANIPVFGDAEWIGVFEVDEGKGHMPDSSQGGIDVPEIREKAAEILEGGKGAFLQRKLKYGY